MPGQTIARCTLREKLAEGEMGVLRLRAGYFPRGGVL